jgi:hypothetical protein
MDVLGFMTDKELMIIKERAVSELQDKIDSVSAESGGKSYIWWGEYIHKTLPHVEQICTINEELDRRKGNKVCIDVSTERQQAIKYLSTLFSDRYFDGNHEAHAAKRLAINAILLQQEQQDGCEYCLKEEEKNSSGRVFYKELPHDTRSLTTSYDAHLQLAYDQQSEWVLHFENIAGDRMFDVRVGLCPMCGRKLTQRCD